MKRSVLFLRLAPYFGMSRFHPQERVPSFSMLTAATFMKKAGWNVEYEDHFEGEPAALARRMSQLAAQGLDAAVLDAWPSTKGIMDSLAAGPLAGVTTVAVGPMATVRPEAYAGGPYARRVAGEYDLAVPALLAGRQDMSRSDGDVSSAPVELDALPNPDPEFLRGGRYRVQSSVPPILGPTRWWFLLSSRGCPMNCAYCSPVSRRSAGTTYRVRSAERVADELRRAEIDHAVNAAFFADDCFNLDAERVMTLCGALRRVGTRSRWVAQCHPSFLSRDMLREMRAAGCSGITMGLESGSPRDLAALGRRTSLDEVRQAACHAASLGLSLTVFLMVGIPGQTRADLDKTREFLREIRPIIIQVAYLTDYAVGDRGPEAPEASQVPLEKYNSIPANRTAMSDAEHAGAQRWLYRSYYFTAAYASLYLRHRLPYAWGMGEWELIKSALSFLRRPAPSATARKAPVGSE